MEINNSTLVILGAVLASPFLGVLVSNVFSRKKIDADARTTNIGGEISIGDAWMKYATKMHEDFEGLEKKFNELNVKFDTMKDENTTLKTRVLKLEGILKANNISYDI